MQKKRFELGLGSFISNSNTRKGQVTIFIILGIVILLVIALIIAFQTEIIKFKPEEIVPTERGRVESVISSCLQEIAEDSLTKMGLQGGYVTLPDEILNDGGKHLAISSFVVVPYWAYGENVAVPSLEDLQDRLDEAIESQIRSCVFDPEKFSETYEISERSGITSQTQLNDAGITFNVNWDIQIRNKQGEVVTEVNNFAYDSDIKLKSAYETAKRIVEVEMQDLKLEDITQDLVALEHPDVPVVGFEVSCSEKRWEIAEVKQAVKDLLRVNIAALQVRGTDVIEYPEDLPYYQNHYLWDLGEFSQNDVSVDFSYQDNYPFTFDVSPRSGKFIKTSSFGQKNSFLSSAFCLQSWKFTYDVSYPVQVTITDDTTGYAFRIAFTVHLVNNIPDRSQPGTSGVTQTFPAFSDDDFCAQKSIPMTVRSYELVDNPQTGVYDRIPLDDVDLTFTCLKFQCDIGSTQYDFGGQGDVSAVRTNFPYCGGGIIRGQKVGFKDDWVRVIPAADKVSELNLIPEFAVSAGSINILAHELRADGTIGPGRELPEDVTSLISIYFDKDGTFLDQSQQHFHESSVVMSPGMEERAINNQNLRFLAKADFTYPLEITIIKEGEYAGGYKGNWTVHWNDISNVKELTFHVLNAPGGSDENLYEFILGLDQNSRLLPLPELG
ncbi:hypothetical protein COV20_02270 [Candidatus Woesearchaeota archaeon CG10_big_fil_rev_8_21_14_0_10_45_16]|nr:MAG: hypothetical protein COV20_02270 [Candidatus Woesearchaeota archaeon CG10_big_fil_rev_8_21_14_0_10_45_16]